VIVYYSKTNNTSIFLDEICSVTVADVVTARDATTLNVRHLIQFNSFIDTVMTTVQQLLLK